MRTRALTETLVATAVALVLAGCAGGDTAGSPPGGTRPPTSEQPVTDHDRADVTFAQAMIPHHAQAIEMAQLAPDRAQSPQVKDLANRIERAQGPEIETMTTWLRTWSAEVPPSPGGMGHGGGMPGMMNSRQMQQLVRATGAEFDRLFLQTMIMHHEGAIAMARTELESGRSSAATRLAQQIIDVQQSEIHEMKALLPPG